MSSRDFIFIMGLLLGDSLIGKCQDLPCTRFEFQQKHMGTMFQMVLYSPTKELAETASQLAFKKIEQLNSIMSDYDPNSELMRFCKQYRNGNKEFTSLSQELFEVLEIGQSIAKESEGKFDMTIRPVVVLWRMSRRTQKFPEGHELQKALSLVNYQDLELQKSNHSGRLKKQGMELDLGGIAKGYAADQALDVLNKRGITSALVAAGGDIAVRNPPPGQLGWRIEIAKLPGEKNKSILLLKNQAVSTSGDSENYVYIDGVRYSHLIDPTTGIGLTGQRSVTVIAPKGIFADAYTKVGSILPHKQALEWYSKRKGVEVRLLYRPDQKSDFQITTSSGFNRFLVPK